MQSPFGVAARAGECERLDLALTREPFSLSRREAKRVLKEHRVAMNGRIVSVESRRVGAGTRLCLLNPEAAVAIVDEYDELLVIDKPPLLPTQPSPDDPNPSLIEIVASLLKRRGDADEAFVVHRLDTNTTGLVLVARSQRAAMKYSKLIAEGDTEKRYLAVVEGRVEGRQTIEAPIGRVRGNLFGIVDSGKLARSVVTALASSDEASLLEVQIETGRTHQIRIHLAHVGHPVIGDVKYGSGATTTGARRPMLHSHTLRVEKKVWSVPPPDDFIAVVKALGLESGLPAVGGRA
jgi:23S rRNA pseudouridine1911/1915/1917 synthase